MLTNILVSIIYCAVCTFVYCCLEKQKGDREIINKWLFAALIVLAAGVRVWYGFRDYFFTYDMGTFKAWGSYAANYGFREMYNMDIFLDYPPGYIYVLYLLEKLRGLLSLGFDSIGCTFLFKLPAMIADFGCAALVYTAAKQHGTKDFARFGCLVFLFMPAVIYNSSVWGQVESIYLLFVALSFYFAIKNKTVFAALCYAVALVTKPQALMFGLVLLFYIIITKSVKEFLKAAAVGGGAFYALVLPCCQSFTDITWVAKLYFDTMQGYKYFTVNAYNIYHTIGLNWKDIDTARFGSINTWVVALVVCLAAFVMLKGKGKDRYFASGALTAVMVFALCTMMHERYLYPAIIMLVMAFAVSGKKQYLAFSALFGSLVYFNSACVMATYYGTFKVAPQWEKAAGVVMTAAALCYAAWLVYDTAKQARADLAKYMKTEYAVAAVTAIYAFVALTGLGSTAAPQSFYQSTEDSNSFVVSFDFASDIEEIYVYSGLGDEAVQPYGRKTCGEFEIAVSHNGTDYEYLTDLNGFSVYTWKKVSAQAQQIMAVKITAKNAGAVLHEIVFKDTEGNVIKGQLRDAVIDEANPYTAARAFDEQHTAPKDTSYYYSMYFDEIYHGRTAYEQIHDLQIYETTHPPLGKILISIGISLFGMTPFGWRIVGALCGVVMLPVMYLLAKALAGKKAGMWACMLMALDFMHLTQTRISTVDTYVVLFVMLTFLFMVYYWKTPFGNVKKEWLNLLLSGVFMGCAVASKWNGAYPMIALAAMFFVCIGFKYKNSGRQKIDRIYVIKTLAYCCFAFVAVPFVIYLASHLAVIDAYTFSDFIRQFINWQQNMYNYHANLVAEHFFSSMWYTWPFCIKPIWFAVATLENGWISTISSFGNPLIWALTPFAAAYCLFRGVKDRKVNCLFASLGYLASYVPWMAVTRLCFIYHYFPCAMFGIVCMAIMFRDFAKSKPVVSKAVWVYIALCLVVFVMFLPVTSGFAAPRGYINFLEMLPQWFFVN
ncbi:MAG: phospholipid carrier-dependent glycosyltransferase [Ruminococcaceae bacterium]|nr:phospholipid carrier-dependent glycosyltransferase [Oscillospiraceae bacterium]